MRRGVRWSLAATLACALLVVCNGGGGNPGSDEDTKQQRDAISKQAHADLDAALRAVQPCSSDLKQIKNVMDPYARLQQVGTTTDADDTRVRDTIAPAARAVARAFARGENVGLDHDGVNALVKGAGIDDHIDSWMDDEKCEQNWSVAYRLDAPQVGNGGLLVESGTIPITVTAASGTLTGSGEANVTFTVNPVPMCEVAPSNATTSISVGGTLRSGTFALQLSRSAYALNTTGTCHTPAGDITTPISVPMQAYSGLAFSVPAKSGASTSDSRFGTTIAVTMLRRR